MEACCWFPLDFAHAPFLCIEFALYMFFVRSHSLEYDYILRATTPLSKQNWGRGVSLDLQHSCHAEMNGGQAGDEGKVGTSLVPNGF